MAENRFSFENSKALFARLGKIGRKGICPAVNENFYTVAGLQNHTAGKGSGCVKVALLSKAAGGKLCTAVLCMRENR